MTVLRLVEVTNKDTISTLKALLERAERGEVIGLMACYRTADRREHSAFTGIYAARPGAAVNASMKLAASLSHLQLSTARPPP